MNLLKSHWAYILAGLSAPAIIMFLKSRVETNHTKSAVQNNPYVNLKAFLTMIQYSEGTYGNNAYRTMYGGQLFSGFTEHPNIAITKSGITSTAAGAYQFLYATWTSVQQSLGLPDFSPISQDRGAIELVRRRGALEDVMSGRFSIAIEKCRKEWASLPGAGYGQWERDITTLMQVYKSAGGHIAA